MSNTTLSLKTYTRVLTLSILNRAKAFYSKILNVKRLTAVRHYHIIIAFQL
jgi:hypothetical protein